MLFKNLLAFRISVRWPIYIINSVDKTKFLYTTSPPTQHHSFFRNYPFILVLFIHTQRSTSKKQLTSMSSKLEPTIWLRDTGHMTYMEGKGGRTSYDDQIFSHR